MDKQTDEQLNRINSSRRSCYRERRLKTKKIRSVERGYDIVLLLKFCEKLLPPAKCHWNRAMLSYGQKTIFNRAYGSRPPSWILEVHEWVSLKSPCRTSYWSSIETIALNRLVFEKIAFLSVQCHAWTEYKFTCVCVSVYPSHFLSTRLQVRPLNGFLQLIA